jgi:hypothetical protein
LLLLPVLNSGQTWDYLVSIYTLIGDREQNLGNGVLGPRNDKSQKGGSAALEFG